MAGRQTWTTQSADPDCPELVGPDGADGRGLEFHFALDDSIFVRRGGIRMFSEPDQGAERLAETQRTVPRAGHHVVLCALGRRIYTTVGSSGAPPYELAMGFPPVWKSGNRLGILLFPLVSGPPAGSSLSQRRGTRTPEERPGLRRRARTGSVGPPDFERVDV